MKDRNLLEEELFETKQALFQARSVKELKFLQNKLKYLMEKLKEARIAQK